MEFFKNFQDAFGSPGSSQDVNPAHVFAARKIEIKIENMTINIGLEIPAKAEVPTTVGETNAAADPDAD